MSIRKTQVALLICTINLTVASSLCQQPSGNDVSSAIPIVVGEPLQLIGDSVTRPHIVYSIRLSANQTFTARITRQRPWTSQGYDAVVYLELRAPNTQTVRTGIPISGLASAFVGDYESTGVLNYNVATSGEYYLDFRFIASNVSVTAETSTKGVGTDQTLPAVASCLRGPVESVTTSIATGPAGLIDEVVIGGTRLCNTCSAKPPRIPALAERLQQALNFGLSAEYCVDDSGQGISVRVFR